MALLMVFQSSQTVSCCLTAYIVQMTEDNTAVSFRSQIICEIGGTKREPQSLLTIVLAGHVTSLERRLCYLVVRI